jgi:hypothetical protein
MNVQISQRGKQYLETARTLLRAAQTMSDAAIAAQLRSLADDYRRRSEKASCDDAAKPSQLAPGAEREVAKRASQSGEEPKSEDLKSRSRHSR